MPEQAQKSRARVQVENPADGGFFYWLVKLYGFAVFVIFLVAICATVKTYGYFAGRAPATPDLSRYATVAPGVTRIYAGDGTLLGEFADEWREVIPYEKFPPDLIHAVLAIEDHDFFSHGGIYLKGIARAAWRNITVGDWAQGGSTITQQVAKQFLTREKTLERKLIEAIVARRIEATYSKEEILAVYLNHIFLGSGAYGVQAAAKRYFSKNIWELDTAELALIAGLAQAPSRDSPLTHPENAKRRRDMVLDAMVKYGYLSRKDAAKWKEKPLALSPAKDVFLTTEPYFSEHIRRTLKKKYGEDGLMKRGLRVETTIQPWMDGVAYENVDFAGRKQDKRQGWRGPEAHLDGQARDTFVERQRQRYGAGPLTPGRRYLALVEEVETSGADVRVGDAVYRLPLKNMNWAAKWSARDYSNDHKISNAGNALDVGDVVWIAPARTFIRDFSDWSHDEKLNPHWIPEKETKAAADEVTLEQTPRVQSSILTFDHQTGYVLAMVGGQDYARSELNRTVQSCRQPGSTYKPIYYSAALDQGMSFGSSLSDIPKAEVDPITGEVWIPTNLHGEASVSTDLYHALVYSKNVPSVSIFKKVGAENVEKWARRLGFTSKIIADRALALGASCTYMDELAQAFAIFARNGQWIDEVYIRRVSDRDGNVLEDNTVYYDPLLDGADRLDRLAATAGNTPAQAIPARAAFLTQKLLRAVVADGYYTTVKQIGFPVAGKTGTSSDTMDLWFVAYTSRWLTAFWLGDDVRERPLGKDDAAYMSAVPSWTRYMHEVSADVPHEEIPWIVPEGVDKNDRGGKTTKRATKDSDKDSDRHEDPAKNGTDDTPG